MNRLIKYTNHPLTTLDFTMPEIIGYERVGLEENTIEEDRNKWASPILELREIIANFIERNCAIRMPLAFLKFEKEIEHLSNKFTLASEPPLLTWDAFETQVANLFKQ